MSESDLAQLLLNLADRFAPLEDEGYWAPFVQLIRDVGPVASGLFVGFSGLCITWRYNAHQRHMAELQLLQNFLPYLQKNNVEGKTSAEGIEFALMMMSALDNSKLVERITEHAATMALGDPEVQIQMLDSKRLNIRNSARIGLSRALTSFASDGDENWILRILARDIDPNGDSSMEVPLVAAIRAGHSGVAKKLLDHQATPDLSRPGKLSPLEVLCGRHVPQHDDMELIHILLDAGADPNHSTPNSDPPLLLAAARGNLEFVASLLARGAKVDTRGKNRQTALIHACRADAPEVISALIGLGARVDLRDGYGKQAIDYAVGDSALEMLLAADARRAALLPKKPIPRAVSQLKAWVSSWR